MTRLLPLFASSTILISSAGASEAGAALARAAAYFRDGRAHAAEFAQTFTPSGFSASRKESGRVTIQAPKYVRFEYFEPQKKTFAFDGTTAAFYSPADRQMTVKELSPDERAQLPLVFLTSPETLARRYEISASATEEVTLRPKDAGAEIAWIRVRVSATGEPSGLSFEAASGDRTEFVFRAFAVEPAKNPAEFRLAPPSDTRIERVE